MIGLAIQITIMSAPALLNRVMLQIVGLPLCVCHHFNPIANVKIVSTTQHVETVHQCCLKRSAYSIQCYVSGCFGQLLMGGASRLKQQLHWDKVSLKLTKCVQTLDKETCFCTAGVFSHKELSSTCSFTLRQGAFQFLIHNIVCQQVAKF